MRIRPVVTAGALLTFLLTVPGVAASAGATTDEGYLVLSVANAGTPRDNNWSSSVVLTCPPDNINQHPKAWLACVQLTRAGGDLNALPRDTKRRCPMLYQPVTARAAGTFDNRRVRWQKTFANSCALRSATGAVFAF